MKTINIKQTAKDMIEDLAGDYPDFGSEHVEEMIKCVIAAEGLSASDQRQLRNAITELGY